MAYASDEAKQKAVAVKEKEVATLEAKVASLSGKAASAQRALAIAVADLEHRKNGPVAPPVSLDGL